MLTKVQKFSDDVRMAEAALKLPAGRANGNNQDLVEMMGSMCHGADFGGGRDG